MKNIDIEGGRPTGEPANWDPERDGSCATISVLYGMEGPYQVMTTAWQFDPAELGALASGHMFLRIFGPQHPVIALWIQDANGEAVGLLEGVGSETAAIPGLQALSFLDVAAERRRVIEFEGYTPAHDDEHARFEIALGAAYYAARAGGLFAIGDSSTEEFLWRFTDPPAPIGKGPANRRTLYRNARADLVRSAQMAIAEIERLDRMAYREGLQDMADIKPKADAPPAVNGNGHAAAEPTGEIIRLPVQTLESVAAEAQARKAIEQAGGKVHPADAVAKLDMWTIYESPADHPGFFVARRWIIGSQDGPGGPIEPDGPTEDVHVRETLDQVRQLVKPGRTLIARADTDDRCIVESWI